MSAQQKIADVAASGQTILDLFNMDLTSLPDISHLTALQKLAAHNNDLQTLPTLPSGLQGLYVDDNNLQTLPPLPAGLQMLYACNNNLQSLPPLPAGLRMLCAYNNNLQTLPTLPSGLQKLYVSNNKLQSLPALPQKLLVLHVSGNNLQSLPDLPQTLRQLNIAINNIHTLPDLSYLTKLGFINIFSNPITYSHVNNADHSLLKNKLTFNQRDIDAFNTAVSLFTNKSTYFSLLPRDVTGIIKEYISYVPVTIIN